jgi:catechol 2,3-dioxygenase-like lactoylglutathione lyase family enzyme
MITGIDHANISTDRLEETTKFFVEVLGLEVGPRPPFAGFRGEWLYAGGAPILHLVERSPARTPDGVIDHFSFAVSDFDATIAKLERLGVKHVAIDIPGGFGRQAFLREPNGATIELTWRPKSKEGV